MIINLFITTGAFIAFSFQQNSWLTFKENMIYFPLILVVGDFIHSWFVYTFGVLTKKIPRPKICLVVILITMVISFIITMITDGISGAHFSNLYESLFLIQWMMIVGEKKLKEMIQTCVVINVTTPLP